MLAVLTRTPDRRFSEIDITSLENVLSISRPALETSLELREPDPVPERDPLTDLYDRPAFHALLDREIGRARGRREPLALLMLDVDRLTTINARIGHLAADDVLAAVARVLNDVVGPRDLRVPDRRRPVRRACSLRPTAATPRGCSIEAPGRASGAPAAGARGRLVLGRRRRAAPEGRRDSTHRARRRRARACEELGTRHGRDGREAAESPRGLAGRFASAPSGYPAGSQRAASGSWSERNGAYEEMSTTPSSGSRSRSQTSLLSAERCLRIDHAAYASARRSA